MDWWMFHKPHNSLYINYVLKSSHKHGSMLTILFHGIKFSFLGCLAVKYT